MKFTPTSARTGDRSEPPPAHADKVPGIVYGAGTPTMIELDHNAPFFALKKEAFHSSILRWNWAARKQVLLRDYQMHAFKPMVMHIDFQRVDATTKVTKKVPLHFVNEENRRPSRPTTAWSTTWHRVTSSAWPRSCRSSSPSTCRGLAKGQSLHVSDLKLPEGIKASPRHEGSGHRVGHGAPPRESRPRRRRWLLPPADQAQEGREAEQKVIGCGGAPFGPSEPAIGRAFH